MIILIMHILMRDIGMIEKLGCYFLTARYYNAGIGAFFIADEFVRKRKKDLLCH